jgi:hypothetical protein
MFACALRYNVQTNLLVELAQLLFHEVYCSHGIPLPLVLDRDPVQDNVFFAQLAALQGT